MVLMVTNILAWKNASNLVEFVHSDFEANAVCCYPEIGSQLDFVTLKCDIHEQD